jgi:hypothetical protein
MLAGEVQLAGALGSADKLKHSIFNYKKYIKY